jgi:hypothetical protein
MESVRYPFLLFWCVFAGVASLDTFFSAGCDPRHCSTAAQELSRLAMGLAVPLFFVAAWMLWKRSSYIKSYGTSAFVLAMLLSETQTVIAFERHLTASATKLKPPNKRQGDGSRSLWRAHSDGVSAMRDLAGHSNSRHSSA